MEPRSEELRRPELGPPLCSAQHQSDDQDQGQPGLGSAEQPPARPRWGSATLATIDRCLRQGLIGEDLAVELGALLIRLEFRPDDLQDLASMIAWSAVV